MMGIFILIHDILRISSSDKIDRSCNISSCSIEDRFQHLVYRGYLNSKKKITIY